MSVKFNVIEKLNPADPQAPKKFYASSIADGEINLRMLSREVAQSSSLSESDVHAVLIGLARVITRNLAQGRIVRLEDFGTFQISISSHGADAYHKVNANTIKGVKLLFRPGLDMREFLSNLKFEKKK